MGEQTGQSGGASNAIFTRGFLPGMVLGVVIGAVVGFVGTELVGKSPKIEIDPNAPRIVQDGERDERPPETDLERQAHEAAERGSAPANTPEDDG